MADDWNARPVSGEIMAAPPAAATSPRGGTDRAGDVVEAEFEAIDSGIRPYSGARPAIAASPTVQGLDVLRPAVAGPRAGGPRHGGPFFWLTGLTLAAASFWISGGHTLARRPATPLAAPSTAMLRIDDVTSRVEHRDGRVMLFVDGEAVNHGRSAAELPSIQIKVAAPDGRVTRYTLGTARQAVEAGGRFSFSSRVELPAGAVEAVSVGF